jgi:hypothetical protein
MVGQILTSGGISGIYLKNPERSLEWRASISYTVEEFRSLLIA